MEMYKYQYSVRNIVMTLDDNYNFTDGSVTYFYIQHDYTNRRLPIIRMNIEMEMMMIKKLYENIDEAKLKMDLYEQQLNENDEVIGTSLYWQHTFKIIPARDQTMYITSDDITTEKAVDQMRNLQLVELYLIDMDAVKWFTQKITTVFADCSRAAALHAVMQMRGIPAGIAIVTPPVNNEMVDYMVIPMGDLIGNIDAINEGYGMYTTYPIIYYDLLNFYCVDKIKPNIVMPMAKEYGNIVLMMKNMTLPDHQVTGSYDDAVNKTHYINMNIVPKIHDYTKEVGSTKFSTVTSVDSKGTVNKTTVNEDATALHYVYAYSNQTVDQIINETMYGPVVDVAAQNCSVAFIKPYKLVTFEMDTQYYNLGLDRGNVFRILDWSLSMTREGSIGNCKYIHDVHMTLQQTTMK